MVLVAADLDELAVLDLVDHGAGVRTIMRTPAETHLACRLFVHTLSPPERLMRQAFVAQSGHEGTDAPFACRSPNGKISKKDGTSHLDFGRGPLRTPASTTRQTGDWTRQA
jgi:hypothetical protein